MLCRRVARLVVRFQESELIEVLNSRTGALG